MPGIQLRHSSSPDGRDHGLWTASPDPTTHITVTAAFQLAIGRAFTADYSFRFRPSQPTVDHVCPCGNIFMTGIHVLYQCVYADARAKHKISDKDHRKNMSPNFLASYRRPEPPLTHLNDQPCYNTSRLTQPSSPQIIPGASPALYQMTRR